MLMYPDDLPSIYGYHCPSVRLFTTISCFFAFDNKSLGMLIYPDDLSPYGIDADGIVVISCVHLPVQLSMSLGLVIRTNRLEEKSIFWHEGVSRWLTLSLFLFMGIIACPPICPSTTFSGFFAFADKSLGRNGIKLACWCIQMIYPRPTSMLIGIVISCIRSSIRPPMGLSLGIADKALGRNGLHFGILMYSDDQMICGYYRSSAPPFTFSVFCAFTNKSLGRNWPVDVSRWFSFGRHRCPINIVVISCIRPSVWPSMGLSLRIADTSLGRNGLHFWHADVSRWLTFS